jgi:hypothetical protein
MQYPPPPPRRGYIMDIAKQETHGDYIVTVYYDPEPTSPRDWDNLGTMVCGHPRYNLGDVQLTSGETWTAPDDVAVILPLGLIDHSGISMYVGGGAHACDPGGWDSGTVGVIYATSADVAECHGADTPENRAKVEDTLRREVETYDKYLTGEVYGFVVEHRQPACECCDHEPSPEQIHSCWGFSDEGDAMDEGMAYVPDDARGVAA